MHLLIHAIVAACDKEEALLKGDEIFKQMTGGDDQPFDWYVLNNDADSRWCDRPRVAVLAVSDAGKKLITAAEQYTRDNLAHHLKKLKGCLAEEGDVNPFDWERHGMTAFYAWSLGKHRGDNIQLYDGDGEGIREKGHLDDVLNNWGRPLPEGEALYIVSADAHY